MESRGIEKTVAICGNGSKGVAHQWGLLSFSLPMACCLAAMCAVSLAGCRAGTRQRMPLEGSVTLDGKPLAEGNIRLLSVNGADAMIVGGEITAGQFQIPAAEGTWPGTYRVEIRAFRKTGGKVQERRMRELDEAVQFLPDRYNSQTTLTAVITASGPNHFDFTLTH